MTFKIACGFVKEESYKRFVSLIGQNSILRVTNQLLQKGF
jgi:hypothetical protein